jgi:hypothetical protein
LYLDLFVEIEDSALEEHFLDCGSIVAVRIVRNPLTGVGRGFGYVLFEVWETSAGMLFEMLGRGCHCCAIFVVMLSFKSPISDLGKLNP